MIVSDVCTKFDHMIMMCVLPLDKCMRAITNFKCKQLNFLNLMYIRDPFWENLPKRGDKFFFLFTYKSLALTLMAHPLTLYSKQFRLYRP